MTQPRFLSSASISSLRNLLGRSIHTIFTPHLDVAGAHLAAPQMSMLVSKDIFINFSCDWSETPRFLNDSWLITVSESRNPIGIDRDESGALLEPCTISMYRAKPIRNIEIFEYQDEDHETPEESVHYDQAIHFKCDEDRSFCIACMLNGPGISEYLHFSEDVHVIREMASQSKCRVVLA
jgi:hypothetical protein